MERNYDCGCTYVVDHFSNDILIDHEAKLWPLLVLLMYRWTVFWDFLNFCVPSNTFLQKLTQALKRVHPKISCRRGDFFAKNVMAVTLGVLHLRKVYNQKLCHKNPSRKKTGSKIQHYSKHILLQTPAKTTRKTPTLHLHGVPSPPHSLAKCKENLQKIHPSDRVFS